MVSSAVGIWDRDLRRATDPGFLRVSVRDGSAGRSCTLFGRGDPVSCAFFADFRTRGTSGTCDGFRTRLGMEGAHGLSYPHNVQGSPYNFV